MRADGMPDCTWEDPVHPDLPVVTCAACLVRCHPSLLRWGGCFRCRPYRPRRRLWRGIGWLAALAGAAVAALAGWLLG